MKEDLFTDPKSWTQTTWDNDQEKLQVLETRVKEYLLDIERRYKVRRLETNFVFYIYIFPKFLFYILYFIHSFS